MLKKIDIYILGQYFKTILFTILIFSIITVVIDFAEKVKDYIEQGISLYEIIFEYTINFVVHMTALLLPIYILISVIFFTSRLATNNEVIAILNAGASYMRFLRPYIIGAFVIVSIQLIGNHFLIPKLNKTRLNFERKYIWTKNDQGKTKNVHLMLSLNHKIFISKYNKKDSTAYLFRLEKYANNQLVGFLKANQAKFSNPNKWKLKNYEIRTFKGNDESFIIGKGKSIDTTLNLFPTDFILYRNQKEQLTSVEILDYIKLQKQRGSGNSQGMLVEFYRRTAEPFTTLILTLIAVAIGSRKIRGGMGGHIAIGIGVGALYVVMSKFAITFAQNDLFNPLLGIWIPNIIFGIFAIFLILTAQK